MPQYSSSLENSLHASLKLLSLDMVQLRRKSKLEHKVSKDLFSSCFCGIVGACICLSKVSEMIYDD